VKKPNRILKKSTGLIQFWFYKPETEKTKLKLKNRIEPKKPNQTKTSRFELVFLIWFGYFFLIKTELNRK